MAPATGAHCQVILPLEEEFCAQVVDGGSLGRGALHCVVLLMFTLTESELPPPGPVQDKTYVWELVTLATVWEPLVALLPLQPPEALQDDELVDDQDNVIVEPVFTVTGPLLPLIRKSTVGAGAGVGAGVAA